MGGRPGGGAVRGEACRGGRGSPQGGAPPRRKRGGSSHPGFPERECTRPKKQVAPSQPPLPASRRLLVLLRLLLDPLVNLLRCSRSLVGTTSGSGGSLSLQSSDPVSGSEPPSHPALELAPGATPPHASSRTGTCAAASNPSSTKAALASASCSPMAADAARAASSSTTSVKMVESEAQKSSRSGDSREGGCSHRDGAAGDAEAGAGTAGAGRRLWRARSAQ